MKGDTFFQKHDMFYKLSLAKSKSVKKALILLDKSTTLKGYWKALGYDKVEVITEEELNKVSKKGEGTTYLSTKLIYGKSTTEHLYYSTKFIYLTAESIKVFEQRFKVLKSYPLNNKELNTLTLEEQLLGEFKIINGEKFAYHKSLEINESVDLYTFRNEMDGLYVEGDLTIHGKLNVESSKLHIGGNL